MFRRSKTTDEDCVDVLAALWPYLCAAERAEYDSLAERRHDVAAGGVLPASRLALAGQPTSAPTAA